MQQDRLNLLFRKRRITETELDYEAAKLDEQIRHAKQALKMLVPNTPTLSADRLAEIVAPFQEWDTRSRDERHSLLRAVSPTFVIAATGNGGIGAGAKTDMVVKGFWLAVKPGTEWVTVRAIYERLSVLHHHGAYDLVDREAHHLRRSGRGRTSSRRLPADRADATTVRTRMWCSRR